MRGVVLAVFGLAALATQAPAQESGWAAKLLRDSDGKIPSGHDFGTVPRGAILQYRLAMTNPYAVPLQIVTRVSCGCVAANPSPAILQSRESGFLDISMDTNRFNGYKSVDLYVTCMNQQYSSTAVLRITANCRLDVMVEPGTVSFGVVPQGQSTAKEALVRYLSSQNFQISGVAPGDPAPFDVKLQEAYRQQGQVGYRVQLGVKPDAAPGTYKGELQLVSNDPQSKFVPIPYEITVQPSLEVSPSLSRISSKAGETQTRRLLIRAGKPFKITGVEGQGDGIAVETTKGAAVETSSDEMKFHTLIIKFTPTAGQNGSVEKLLTIKTDLDGGASVTAKVEASVASETDK